MQNDWMPLSWNPIYAPQRYHLCLIHLWRMLLWVNALPSLGPTQWGKGPKDVRGTNGTFAVHRWWLSVIKTVASMVTTTVTIKRNRLAVPLLPTLKKKITLDIWGCVLRKFLCTTLLFRQSKSLTGMKIYTGI